MSAQNQIEQLFQQADEYYAMSQWSAAIDVYTHILEIDPTCVPAYVHRGLIVHESGNPEKAMRDFERALQIDPRYGLAYYGRGWVKHTREDYRGELQDAIHGLELDPNNAGMYYRRIGAACHGLKKYEQAIQAYNEAIRLNADMDEGAIYNRGLCYHDMGEYRLALADFNRSLELDPGWTWALAARGRVYMKMEDYERAVADYDEVLNLQPNYFRGYVHRGIAYLKMGDRTKAKADFKRAQRLTKSPAQRRTVKKLLRAVNWSPLLEKILEWLRES